MDTLPKIKDHDQNLYIKPTDILLLFQNFLVERIMAVVCLCCVYHPVNSNFKTYIASFIKIQTTKESNS